MNTTINKKAIKPNDIVDVIPCGLRALPIRAKVESISESHAAIDFEDPPVWYQTQERIRGIVLHPSATRRLNFFKDSAGTWTAAETMKQYTIQKRN